ncbi:MAG: hypothetical protein ABIH69_03510 [bacterium]|nr:hypothetical protein [Candidatus Margulisiibacteriota bacterium]
MSLDLLLSYIALSWANLYPLILNLVLSLVVIFVGLVAARLAGQLITIILKAIMIDRLAGVCGLDLMLEKAGIKKTVAELFGGLVYWSITLVVASAILNVFNIQVELALLRIFSYVGIVFLSALILGVGLFLASLIAGVVRIALAALGLEEARTVSRIMYYVIIIFAFFAALAELGFDPNNLAPHLGVIIGFPALAAAIAFGLGCKDMAADFFHNLFKGR